MAKPLMAKLLQMVAGFLLPTLSSSHSSDCLPDLLSTETEACDLLKDN